MMAGRTPLVALTVAVALGFAAALPAEPVPGTRTEYRHNADYTRISGQLLWEQLEGGFWRLRYIRPNSPEAARDKHRGSFVLGRPKLLKGFKSGKWVRITGRVSPNQVSIWQAGTVYDVKSVSGIGPVPKRIRPDPQAFWVELADGRVLTGRLGLKELTVRTASKTVKVPVAELAGFAVGLDGRAKLAERIEALVRDLGANDYRKREAAQAELIRMGPALRTILAEYAEDPDVERAERVGRILEAYKTWAAKHPDVPPPALEPIRRRTEVHTTSSTIVGRIMHKRVKVATAGGTVEVALAEIRRATKVGSKPDLDACLVHGRIGGERTDFVRDVPEALARQHRRLTRTVLTMFNSVLGRHSASPWLYPVKGKKELPRVVTEDGKKYYPIWGTWRQLWGTGWKHLDENGARVKGPTKTGHPHHESKVDYYVVPLRPQKKRKSG